MNSLHLDFSFEISKFSWYASNKYEITIKNQPHKNSSKSSKFDRRQLLQVFKMNYVPFKITDVQFNWGKIFANIKMNDWLCWLTFRHFFNWPLHNLYCTVSLFVGSIHIWPVFFSFGFNDFHWFKIIGDRSKRHNLLLIVKINFWFALLCVCCARFYRHLFKICIKCAITVYASNEGNKVIHLATYALMKW